MKSLYQCTVLILSRAEFFAFAPYNAPVRTWAIVTFAKVNEAKCFMITNIRFWENCTPSLHIQITARYLFYAAQRRCRTKRNCYGVKSSQNELKICMLSPYRVIVRPNFWEGSVIFWWSRQILVHPSIHTVNSIQARCCYVCLVWGVAIT